MKKFFCMMSLLLTSMVAMATAQMKAYSPPEQDIGYEQMTVAEISLPGMAFAIDQQLNIVGWQTPVTLQEVSNMSAQVIDIMEAQTAEGYMRVTLVSYRWPNAKTETMNSRSDYSHYDVRAVRCHDSFMDAHTEI